MSGADGRDGSQLATVRGFLEVLERTQLLSAAEFAKLAAAWANRGQENSQALAKDLVTQGTLTKYQAAAIYQGKIKGLVLGPYVMLDKLGSGGMGTVYLARHRETGGQYAIKVLASSATKSPDAVRRFQREAEIAARLNHPNIVRAVEAGSSGNQYYFVMEYIQGIDLGNYIRTHKRMPWQQALACITQAARALDYAHSQGLVHRDIKPGNLFLTQDGSIKVLDLGLARLNDAGDSLAGGDDGLTQTGQVIGTADYMAPEQAMHTRNADARADVYSLGCSLYRLLTGKLPFDGESLIEKILAHREQPVPSVRAMVLEVPPGIDVVLGRMLAKRPEDRFQTMRDVVTALERAPQSTDFSQVANLPPAALPPQAMSPSQQKLPPQAATTPVAPAVAYAAPVAQPVMHAPIAVPVGYATAIPQSSPPTAPQPAPVSLSRRRRRRWSLAALVPWLFLLGLAAVGYHFRDVIIEEAITQTRLVMDGPIEKNATPTSDERVPGNITPTPSPTKAEPAPPVGTPAKTPPSPPKVTPPPANRPRVPRLNAAEQRQLAEDLVARGAEVSAIIDGDRSIEFRSGELVASDEFLISRIKWNANAGEIADDLWQRILRLPALQYIILSSKSGTTGERLRELIDACPTIVSLWLPGNRLTDADIETLDRLPKLRILSLGDTRITKTGLVHVARCKSLTYLSLYGLPITSADLVPLQALSELRYIRLSGTQVDDGIASIKWSWRSMQGIEFDNSRVTVGARRQLLLKYPGLSFSSPPLGLPSGRNGYEKLKAPVIRPASPKLPPDEAAAQRQVAQAVHDMGGTMDVELEAQGNLPSQGATLPDVPFDVTRISLVGEPVSVALLTEFAKLRLLRTLDLSGSELTADHAAAIASIPTLRAVILDRAKLNDDIVTKLCTLPVLELLSLADTAVTDASVPALRRLTNLKWLDLSGTKITDQAVRPLLSDHATLETLLIQGLSVSSTVWNDVPKPRLLQWLDVRGKALDSALVGRLREQWGLPFLYVSTGPLPEVRVATGLGTRVLKLAVPSDAELRQAQAIVRGEYTMLEKSIGAKKNIDFDVFQLTDSMIERSVQFTDQPARQLAFLVEARNLAAATGDIGGLKKATTNAAGNFAVDECDWLCDGVDVAVTQPFEAKDFQPIANHLLKELGSAIERNDFSEADRWLATLTALAQKFPTSEYPAQVAERSRLLNQRRHRSQ